MKSPLFFILFLGISFALISCFSSDKNKLSAEIQYIYLNKLSGKTTSSYSVKEKRDIYIETILIENYPQNRDSALALQKEYFQKNNKICMLDPSIDLYSMRFYEKTKCTEYFIENAQDPGGFSSRNIYDDCGIKDAGFSFYYKRNKKNPSLWTANKRKNYYGYEYHDTLYCDYKKMPPWKQTPWIPEYGE